MKHKRVLLALFAGLLCNCATYFLGTQRTIRVETTPAGASARLHTEADREGNLQSGVTPIDLTLDYGGRSPLNDFQVTLKRPGFRTQTIIVERTFTTLGLVGGLLFIPFVTDFITGALWEPNKRVYTINMQPVDPFPDTVRMKGGEIHRPVRATQQGAFYVLEKPDGARVRVPADQVDFVIVGER